MTLTSLHDLCAALQDLIYAQASATTRDLDIRYDAPSEEWVEFRTVPTISLFLFDLRENTEKRDTAPQNIRLDGSKSKQRLAPRRMDLHYMVSALAADVEVEHEMLWQVARTLMRYPTFTWEALKLNPEDLSDLEDSQRTAWEAVLSADPAITARLHDKESGRSLLDLWNALGTHPRPALYYVVTAPLDLDITFGETSLVLSRRVRYIQERTAAKPEQFAYTDAYLHGMVRDKHGRPVAGATIKMASTSAMTDASGAYALHVLDPKDIVSGAKLTITTPNGTVVERVLPVPSSSYDIDLGEVALF